MDWLPRQRLVLPSHSHGLRALIERAAAQRKLKLDVQVSADSFRVLTSLVEEGLGYSRCCRRPRCAAKSMRGGLRGRRDLRPGADARTRYRLAGRSS